MKGYLGYQEFLKFAADFNLSASVILSTLEIGDLYLSSIKLDRTKRKARLRKMSFEMFWECLVRCACVAYSKIVDVVITEKIRVSFFICGARAKSQASSRNCGKIEREHVREAG